MTRHPKVRIFVENTGYPYLDEMIGEGIEAIKEADFLTDEQKRDILYNNAVRFLQLDPND